MEEGKSDVSQQNSQKVFCKQPISCPWITAQPYPSTVNKNKAADPSLSKLLPSIPLSVESRGIGEKACPSLQHSSSQFFYFLRLMQLFPETHPATLHTVLNLCKNDFFCAVDKLLYAKRCKALYSRSQNMFKRCSNRNHPYSAGHSATDKSLGQDKDKGEGNIKGVVCQEKVGNVPKVQIVVENDLDVDVVNDINDNTSKQPENDSQLSSTPRLPSPATLEESLKVAKDLSCRNAPQDTRLTTP